MHDIIEDTKYDYNYLKDKYGKFITYDVFMVTIPQKISKIERPMTEKELMDTAKKLYSKDIEPINIETSNEAIDKEKYKGKKILIVDDNKLNIKVARRALADFDLEVEEALSGQEAIEKVKTGNTYDLILMDIMMPEMSGETALLK